MVVDYLSFQPDWVGYQVSTKQGSGPYEVMLMARAIKIQNVIFLFDDVGIGVIASSLANLDL